MTRKEKILLAILALIKFVHIMDFMIMMPLGPQLMDDFEISPAQFGAIVSSYTFSAGIFGILGAFFIDKFDRKKALMFLFAGFTIGTFACAFSPTHHLLIQARIFTGAFGGILGALVLSIVADTFPVERRSTAMGIVMGAFSAASVFGVPFGLYVASVYNWQAPFIILGGVSFLIFFAIIAFVPSITGHMDGEKRSPIAFLKNIARKRNQQLALLMMVLLMFGHFSIVPYIAPYMVSNIGFSEIQLTYIYLLGGAVTLFTSPLFGRWADKFGNIKMFTIMGILAIIPIALITNMPQVPIAVALIPTTMFFIFVGGRMIPALTVITATAIPQNRGGFMTITTAIQQIGSGTAAFIAGLIVVKNESTGQLENYPYVGLIAIVASLACIILIRYITPTPVPKAPVDEEPLPTETAQPADTLA